MPKLPFADFIHDETDALTGAASAADDRVPIIDIDGDGGDPITKYIERDELTSTGGSSTFSGVLLALPTQISAADYTTQTAIGFGTSSEVFDVGGWHDESTNNERITVPASADGKYAMLVGQMNGSSFSLDVWMDLAIGHYNSSGTWQNGWMQQHEAGISFPAVNVTAGPVLLAEADWFELRFRVQSDTSVNVVKSAGAGFANTQFGLWVIGA